MAVDIRKHTIPGSGEAPQRSFIDALSLSVNDIIHVANGTERAQLWTDLVAAGHNFTTRPVIVDQADTKVLYRCDNGAADQWVPLETFLMGRTSVAEGLVNADTALTAVITVPSLPVAYKVIVTAFGKAGNGASARSVAWSFDSHPGTATVTADPQTRVAAATSTFATVVATETIECPAGVDATFRVMYRADNNGFNTGSVTWMRSRA